jgi:hypothetical protein
MEVHDAHSSPVMYGSATASLQADSEYHCSIVQGWLQYWVTAKVVSVSHKASLATPTSQTNVGGVLVLTSSPEVRTLKNI